MTTYHEPHVDFDFAEFDDDSRESKEEFAAAAIRKALELLVQHSNIKLAVASLGYAVGLYSDSTCLEFAREFGVTKQAFHAAAKRWRENLNLNKTLVQRSQNGCDAMSRAYHAQQRRKTKQLERKLENL